MEWIIASVIGAAIIAGITLAFRNARKRGAAEANARSEEAARNAENVIHEAQAERRSPEETRRRLDEGSF